MITISIGALVGAMFIAAAVAAIATAFVMRVLNRGVHEEAQFIHAWVDEAETVTAWTKLIPDEASTVARRPGRRLTEGWAQTFNAVAERARDAMERLPFVDEAPAGRHAAAVSRG